MLVLPTTDKDDATSKKGDDIRKYAGISKIADNDDAFSKKLGMPSEILLLLKSQILSKGMQVRLRSAMMSIRILLLLESLTMARRMLLRLKNPMMLTRMLLLPKNLMTTTATSSKSCRIALNDLFAQTCEF